MTSFIAAAIWGVSTWVIGKYLGVPAALGLIMFSLVAGKLAQTSDHKVLAAMIARITP